MKQLTSEEKKEPTLALDVMFLFSDQNKSLILEPDGQAFGLQLTKMPWCLEKRMDWEKLGSKFSTLVEGIWAMYLMMVQNLRANATV